MSEDGSSAGIRGLVPDAIRGRYAVKFGLILAVLGIIIGGIGLAATSTVSAQVEEDAKTEFRSTATQQASTVEQWLEQNAVAAKLASKRQGLGATGEGSTSTVKTALSKVAGELRFQEVQGNYVIRKQGNKKFVVAGSRMKAGKNVKNTRRPWLADVQIPGRITVTNVVITKTHTVGNVQVIAFMSKIPGAGNRFLVLEYSVDTLTSNIGSRKTGSRVTHIVDGTGTIQASTLEQHVGKDYAKSAAGMKPANLAVGANAENGTIARAGPNKVPGVNGEYTVGYAPVQFPESTAPGSTYEMALLVHQPTSEVFGFVQTISRWGIIVTVAMVLTVGLFGAVLGYNTSTSINRLKNKAQEMEEGNLEVDVSSSRVDEIGQLYGAFDNMRRELQSTLKDARNARNEAEIARAEAEEMADYLQERAEEYSEIMQKCARGDLTQRMEPEGENEAMDRIAEEFNDMITELEMTTGQLKTFAEEVEEDGRSVQQSAETVRDASEQVADSVQRISDDAYDQKERLQKISEEMDAVSETLETFADENPEVDFGEALGRIQEVATTIDEALDLGEQTMAESENVAGAAEEQAAELNEVSSLAQELTRNAEYLGDGLNNFETEEEHEFVFQTGAAGSAGDADESTGDR